MNFRRLRAVARKEALHIVRDPLSLIAALVIPLVLLLLFGYALTLDVDRIPAYVYDLDKTPQSRQLISRFQGSRYFQILGFATDYTAIGKGIDDGRILMAVVVPRDFGRSLLRGGRADVQLLLDGTDSNTASLALGYAQGVMAAYSSNIQAEARNRETGGRLRMPVEPEVRVWYNSSLKSKNYIVPGLIAVILMIIASMLTSLTIAREWETGTMEQLLATPVRPAELVLGKLSAFFVLGMIDMAMSLVVGVLVFGVPMEGNLLLLFFASSIFLFGALCWGIMLSSVLRSQLLAYQVGLTTSFLPAFLMSGFIYSIDNMPKAVQLITFIVPARYFVTILKGIFLKGAGLGVLWFELLLLMVYALLVFVLAARKLRRKVA
ncbi:MAG: ABC transporter permease [Bryobacterales bacterium]|nr:ABC transporter permease [Bryobacterales bacterium]